MLIKFSNHPIHLQDGLNFDRKYTKLQDIQNEKQKVFYRDAIEASGLCKNRRSLMDRLTHTVMQSATSFSDTRAEILKEIKEEKGQYDYADIVNACGLSYAKLYSEIERRYENEQKPYYKTDGTLQTKEAEIEWLDIQYEQEVAWQKSCVQIALQEQAFQGQISVTPTKEIEELEDSFYQSKKAYIKLYQESKQMKKPLALQNYMFNNHQMYAALNRLING